MGFTNHELGHSLESHESERHWPQRGHGGVLQLELDQKNLLSINEYSFTTYVFVEGGRTHKMVDLTHNKIHPQLRLEGSVVGMSAPCSREWLGVEH